MSKQATENVGTDLFFSHLPTRLERNKSLGAGGKKKKRKGEEALTAGCTQISCQPYVSYHKGQMLGS